MTATAHVLRAAGGADASFALSANRDTCADTIARILPVGLLVVLEFHYHSWTTRRSLGQYFSGVYRSRVLAREVILGIGNSIDRVLGGGRTPGFAVGWVTVTGGGFLVASWLLRRHIYTRAPSMSRVQVFMVASMAASSAVLTPYDLLSYALIIATVIAAGSGRTLATAALAAAAVATRESGFLAVAVIMASCASPRAAVRHRPLWAAAGAAVATYVVLKVVFKSGGGVVLYQHVGLRSNLTDDSAWAIALAVTLVAAGRWAAGPAGGVLRARRRVLWLLALPYLIVVACGGIWSEAPRLIMPLVLGEALLAVGAAHVGDRLGIPVHRTLIPPSPGVSVGRVEVFVLAALAASAAVLTPRDFFSYALIIATVSAAASGKPVATAAFAAAAVATRESGLLAIAVIMASCASPRAALRHRPLLAAAGAAVTTCVVLDVAFRSSSGIISLQHVALRSNLTAESIGAVALAGALVAAGRWAARPAGAVLRARRRLLWLLALPYLAVAVSGSWKGALAVVMPLVLGEALLAVLLDPSRAASVSGGRFS